MTSAFSQSECVCRLLKLHFGLWYETASLSLSASLPSFVSPRSHEDHGGLRCHGDDVCDDGAGERETAERFQRAEGKTDGVNGF